MKAIYSYLKNWMGLMLGTFTIAIAVNAADLVKVDSGILEGTVSKDPTVRLFKGVPFAQPPVGNLRWKAPQPVKPWEGVRKAVEWGNRCPQPPLWGQLYTRDTNESEDCLYLNIWTPAKSDQEKLPVYFWIHGGGFATGSSSEPRYDGEFLAKQGIVVVDINYRLNIFGFFSHPELTQESPDKASGNYGMLDQVAALKWVKKNIAAFGGNPDNITIGGESAGSIAVSGLMASPLSKNLMQKAIGESGSFLTAEAATTKLKTLSETEIAGVKFAESMGAKSLADLRKMPADELLKAVKRGASFGPNLDGYFFQASPNETYTKGQQAHIPLLAGWNSSEMGMAVAYNPKKPTAANFSDILKQQFKDKADLAAKLYPADTDEEAVQSAATLYSDGFIVFITWKWIEEQLATAKTPIYRYVFSHVPDDSPLKKFGAAHAEELPYAFNALDFQKSSGWQPDDRKAAQTMALYWANFIKTGNPNGTGLPEWPEFGQSRQVMNIDAVSEAEPEKGRARYEFMDGLK